MKLLKRLRKMLILIFLLAFMANHYITCKAKPYHFSDSRQLPKNKVGLVLGTSKYTTNGRINLYYKHRLEAAYRLYKMGKIQYILISGDNSKINYDEPTDFKNDLIKKGVPKAHIVLDYAGFRTLDTVIRAKAIFNLSAVTIISQQFHNERALFLARQHHINAIAYNAKGVSKRYGLKTQLREYLARTKAILDILCHVQPKFLGKKIPIV